MFLILIFLISFLRFYKLGDHFIFDIDTQYQALLAQTIIKHFHIIWIGVSSGSIGYYLGPGLVYLTAFLLWITDGDPISLAFFSSLIGVITALSIYFIVNDLFGKRVALVATIIYGFSSFIIGYDHRYWPIFVPLTALWLYYSLVKAQKNSRWLILSVILISLSYHLHLTLLIFWPFIIWSFIKLFKKIDRLTWFTSILSYFVITFPLLVFDLVHKFDNLLMPVKFIAGLFKKNSSAIQFHLNFLLTSLNKIWFIDYERYKFFPLVFVLFLILILISLFQIKRSFSIKLLISVIFIFFLLFTFYPGPIQEYYLVFLFPFISLAGAIFLAKLPWRFSLPLLLLFVLVNTFQILTYHNKRGLTVKKNLIKNISRQIDSPYYLSFDSALDMEGWRYLFEAYGKKPAQSKADAQFGWIYQKDISKTKPPTKITVSSDFRIKISPN